MGFERQRMPELLAAHEAGKGMLILSRGCLRSEVE